MGGGSYRFTYYFFTLGDRQWIKAAKSKKTKVPKMRKRFKTWRWILIQVNANPRASPAISVWLSAAREINPRKLLPTFSNHMASTPLQAVSFPPSLSPLSCHPSLCRGGEGLGSRPAGIFLPRDSLIWSSHTIPILPSSTAGEIYKILAEHQTPLPLSLLHLLQPLYKNLKSVLESFNGNR